MCKLYGTNTGLSCRETALIMDNQRSGVRFPKTVDIICCVRAKYEGTW